MILGAIGKGIMGAGRGARMAGRVFKRKGGKNAPEVPASQQTVDVEATPVNVKPQTPLISSSSTFNAKNISKATPSLGTETLEGTAFRIKTSLVDVDTLLRGSIALDELKEKSRKKKRKQSEGKEREKKLENAVKKNKNKFGLGKFIPKTAKSIFGNIINFFVTLFLGKILLNLLDNTQLLAGIVKTIAGVANFLIEWGGKLLNTFVTLIDWGYKIYDGIRGTVGNLFGESGMKLFDKLSGVFTLLLNTALIAAMTAGRAGMLGGGGPGVGGLTKVGKGGVKPAAVTRYAKRFGRNAAVKKFGSEAVERYGGTAARSTATKLGRKGLTSILGKTGSKTFLKTVKRFISPTVRGIPIIGGLIDFALNLLVFKEPVGKAAFKAIGAGLGAWILGAVGSIVPGFGTLLAAMIGGLAGDLLGGLMYDAFFKNKSGVGDPLEAESDDITPTQPSKDLSATALTGGTAGIVSSLQKGKITKPKVKTKKVKVKPKRTRVRGKKPGSRVLKRLKKSFTTQRNRATKAIKPLTKAAKPVVKKATKAIKPITKAAKPVVKKATQAVTKNVVKPATKVATSASKSLTKNVVKPATKVATTATKATTAAAKTGVKAVSGTLKAAKKIISPIVKKIPFLGSLVDFLLNVFVFKESLGRSAFMAIGAGLGAWIGGMIGTAIPVPFVGSAIGAFLGGAGGDLLGGLIYDGIFGKEDKKEGDKKDKDLKGDKGDKGDTITSKREVSGRFDTNTGKAYINDQEVSADEYNKFINLSEKEQLQQYGRTPINAKTNDYSGIDTQASYDKDEGSTTYVVRQKSNTSGNSGSVQGSGGEKEMAALAMSSSSSSGSNWSKELQKR